MSYVDPEDGEDVRGDFVRGYAKESIGRVLLLSEIHDLAAMYSAGMAVTCPKKMGGFVKVSYNSAVFYVVIGHEAEAFLNKLLVAKNFVAFTQIHELLTLASQDKDVRGLTLDGEILNQNKKTSKVVRRA
jgi:hypothetical protein